MPTGYTDKIKDGITFEQYALDCSRAFGALIHMRDLPLNVEIPDIVEPSNHYSNKLEEARKKLTHLKKMSMKRRIALYEKESKHITRENKEAIERKKSLEAKYRAMLEKVVDWNPPSEDHVRLREFMIEQIEQSINYDCDTYYEVFVNSVKSFDGWWVDLVNNTLKDIEY